MFGIGGFELLLIVLFAFLVFGPDKLPEVLQTANQALQKFRKAQQEVDTVIKKEMVDESALKSDNPLDLIDSAAKKVEKSQESFAERKARYDQERKETAQKPAPSSGSEVSEKPAPSSLNEEVEAPEADESKPEPRPAPVKASRTGGAIPSADELYGVKPTVKARKKAPSAEFQDKEV